MSDLRSELASLLNRNCAENVSNTPDFILAQYLLDSLTAFDRAVYTRDRWYGVKLSPGQGAVAFDPKGNQE